VEVSLEDPAVAPFVKGVGFQWAGKQAIAGIHRRYPHLPLYQTEQECGDGRNDWRYCRYAWTLMKHYLRSGATAYMYWSISLEKGGVSRWGWAQNSLVTVDRETRTYDPRFGGGLQDGTVVSVEGGGIRALGEPPEEPSRDWAVLVRRSSPREAVAEAGPAFAEETTLLVKLRSAVGSASRVGDRVTASVISPETCLGGILEGTVAESPSEGRRRLTLRFSDLRFRDRRFAVRAAVTGFVSSKNHALVDDEERPAAVEDGAIVSEGPELRLDEGAELTLVATPGS
jgi:hypothetical protein